MARWTKYPNFTGADLREINLRYTPLTHAILVRADLRGQNLRYIDISRANLTRADLEGADLMGANLSWSDLRYANLTGVSLTGADLRDTCFQFANLSGATYGDLTLTSKSGISSFIKWVYPIIYIDVSAGSIRDDDIIVIWDKAHRRVEWKKTSDDEIIEMAGKRGLRWWWRYRDRILNPVIFDGYYKEPCKTPPLPMDGYI